MFYYREPIRVEAQGLVPVARVSVHAEYVDDQGGALGEHLASQLRLLVDLAPSERDSWQQAQRLLHDVIQVLHPAAKMQSAVHEVVVV